MLLLSLLTTTSKRMEKIFRVCNLYQYLPTQQASTELYLEKSWYCITKSSRDITKMCDIAINFAYNCLSVSPTRHDKGDENNRKILEVVKIRRFFLANFVRLWFRSHTITSIDGIGTCWKVIEGVSERFFRHRSRKLITFSRTYIFVCVIWLNRCCRHRSERWKRKRRRKKMLYTPFIFSDRFVFRCTSTHFFSNEIIENLW